MTTDSSWRLMGIEDERGKAVYRIMMEKPHEVDCTKFTENVSIHWHYAETGLPDTGVSDQLREFEGLVTSLDDLTNNSFLIFVFSGRGKREWNYCAKDYDQFMEMLNKALSSYSGLPIEIEHSPDPDWEYWQSVRDYVTEENNDANATVDKL